MPNKFKLLLAKLADGDSLNEIEAQDFFSACLRGEPTQAQIASALTAIHIRGETVVELTACARAMRAASTILELPYDVIDVCGTGGDGCHTLNISTAVGFVSAGAGLKVAKHGNLAVTSKSGTADVLRALGVNINATPLQQRQAIDDAGICFLFAQTHHSAMRHVASIRQELGFRTLFNLLGPLTNPARAQRQVIGVASSQYLLPMAMTLNALGTQKAWIVHGNGLDELTTTGRSEIYQIEHGQITNLTISPEDFGLKTVKLKDITGGLPQFNADAMLRLLQGEIGAYRDIVALNTAAALVVADIVTNLAQGIKMANNVIDSGRAEKALTQLITATNS